MAVNNSPKTARIMMVVSIVIGLAALTVCVLAVGMQEYIIAVAMILVAAWQVVNYKNWKKCL